ncbi:MAG: hypothetical protein ABIJ28_03480 [Patescibacteria group bacterium]
MKDKLKIIMPVVLIVIFSFFLYLISIKDNNERRGTKIQADLSAQKGWQWLYHYQGKLLDPSIPLIIKNINEKHCQSSSEIKGFWENALQEFENHQYLPVFERFFYDSPNYKPSEKIAKILKTQQDYYNDALAQALYCDFYPVKEDFEENVFSNINNESGYDLTHKFWSAILFKNNGCESRNYNIDEIIYTGAEKIKDEQEKSSFDDLYAERTAMLLENNFENFVSEEWIKKIIENQKDSGAWATPTYFSRNYENPHTTTLAIWSLVQYSGKCPF